MLKKILMLKFIFSHLIRLLAEKSLMVILKQKIRNLEFSHEIFSFGQLLQVVFKLVASIVIFCVYCGQNSSFFHNDNILYVS